MEVLNNEIIVKLLDFMSPKGKFYTETVAMFSDVDAEFWFN